MQAVKDLVAPLGHGDDIESVCGRIDHRRAGYAELGRDGRTIQDIGDARRCLARYGIGEADLPERGLVRAGVGVRVECVDAIVLGGHEHNVVNALAGDGDGGQVEWLRVELSIDRPGEDLTELGRVHIRGRQNRFREILSGPGEIVTVSRNTDLGAHAIGQRKNKESSQQHSE